MNEKNRGIVIGVTSLLLVTLILLGLTYAYYKTRIVGNTNEKSVSVVSKNLSVTYQNESAVINAEGIEPGYTATKTFEVKNTGSEKVNYSVMLDNVTNTFTRLEDWTYTISENGTELKNGTLPNSNRYILYSESIDAGVTKSYTLVINYANLTDVNQSEDMGKSLSFRINIGEEKINVFKDEDENTLLYAIGNDNVVSEPLSVPGKSPSGITSYGEGELSSTTSSYSVSSTYQGYYFVYGTGYTFDEKTGLYTLTGVTTTSDTYASSYSELEGKYVAYPSLYSISAKTKERALNLTTSGLTNIYKITSATSSKFTYQTLSKSTPNYETEATLSTTEDDYGTSYYYRGAVENNYVNYSGMCWRIVRVQGDGTIKLALADENGECDADTYSTSNAKSAFVDGGATTLYRTNASHDWDDYVYDISNVNPILFNWINNKSLDTSKLNNADWCVDTTTSKSDSGYYYLGEGKLYDTQNANPTLICHGDVYTNQIGILTADEVAFAGSTSNTSGTYNYYLQTNANGDYWTMSPSQMEADERTWVYYVSYFGGLIGNYYAIDENHFAVRPSIVLNSNVTISSGNGMQTNPYVIN